MSQREWGEFSKPGRESPKKLSVLQSVLKSESDQTVNIDGIMETGVRSNDETICKGQGIAEQNQVVDTGRGNSSKDSDMTRALM